MSSRSNRRTLTYTPTHWLQTADYYLDTTNIIELQLARSDSHGPFFIIYIFWPSAIIVPRFSKHIYINMQVYWALKFHCVHHYWLDGGLSILTIQLIFSSANTLLIVNLYPLLVG